MDVGSIGDLISLILFSTNLDDIVSVFGLIYILYQRVPALCLYYCTQNHGMIEQIRRNE